MCTRGLSVLSGLLNQRNVRQIFVKNYTSAVHTFKVADQIKKRRETALLGGGQKRIDAQHKKVCDFILCKKSDKKCKEKFLKVLSYSAISEISRKECAFL